MIRALCVDTVVGADMLSYSALVHVPTARPVRVQDVPWAARTNVRSLRVGARELTRGWNLFAFVYIWKKNGKWLFFWREAEAVVQVLSYLNQKIFCTVPCCVTDEIPRNLGLEFTYLPTSVHIGILRTKSFKSFVSTNFSSVAGFWRSKYTDALPLQRVPDRSGW